MEEVIDVALGNWAEEQCAHADDATLQPDTARSMPSFECPTVIDDHWLPFDALLDSTHHASYSIRLSTMSQQVLRI